jgi:hypothetical protein
LWRSCFRRWWLQNLNLSGTKVTDADAKERLRRLDRERQSARANSVVRHPMVGHCYFDFPSEFFNAAAASVLN